MYHNNSITNTNDNSNNNNNNEHYNNYNNKKDRERQRQHDNILDYDTWFFGGEGEHRYALDIPMPLLPTFPSPPFPCSSSSSFLSSSLSSPFEKCYSSFLFSGGLQIEYISPLQRKHIATER